MFIRLCWKIIFYSAVLMISASCGETDSASCETDSGSSKTSEESVFLAEEDTVLKWQEWAMSSSDGLWENSPPHSFELEYLRSYGGEDNPVPQFFTVNWMEVSGDTLFISDRARESLVCMNSDGEVLWEYGEPGEGPGHFTYIGPVAVSDSWIAVCNIRGDRVELITREGELIESYSIRNPLFVVKISEHEFAILSRAESGGDIHLFDVESGHITSFGECPWPGGDFTSWSANEYSAVLVDERYVVMNDFFTYGIYIFDLEQRILINDFIREHPSGDLPENIMTMNDDGSISGMFFFLLGKLFLGPEGCINIKLAAIQKDGSVISSRETIGPAPVTIIDRYDLNGDYLDSYCIPIPSITDIRCSDTYLYAAQANTGTIYLFEVK